jgi:hypothetical protein
MDLCPKSNAEVADQITILTKDSARHVEKLTVIAFSVIPTQNAWFAMISTSPIRVEFALSFLVKKAMEGGRMNLVSNAKKDARFVPTIQPDVSNAKAATSRKTKEKTVSHVPRA